MARVDEKGYLHPTEDDLLDVQAIVHMTYCRECNRYALELPQPFEALREMSRGTP